MKLQVDGETPKIGHAHASKVKSRVAKFSDIYAHYFEKLWFWMKTNVRKRFSDVKNPYLMP